jgi:hypothetical protein
MKSMLDTNVILDFIRLLQESKVVAKVVTVRYN